MMKYARLLLLTPCLIAAGCATGGSRPAVSPQQQAALVDELDQTPLNRSAARLSNDTATHLAWAKTLRKRVLEVEGTRTIENTLAPLNDMWMHLEAAHSECSLLEAVHPDEAVRDEASKQVVEITGFITDVNLDRGLYEAYAAVDLTGADDATRYMVEKALRDFRREGVDADEATRNRLRTLNDEIVQTGQRFGRTIREDRRTIRVSPEALEGLPQDWIAAHPTGPDGRVEVSTDSPDYQPFMGYARDADARLSLYRQFYDRGYPSNVETLNELIARRHEKAHLLGYDTWAAYITEDKMIETAENAQTFIDRIASAVRPAVERERAILLDRKRQDDPDAQTLEEWEWAYYQNRVAQERFNLDPQEARKYFDFPNVREGLFEITGKLFGVEYAQVHGLNLWHADVTAWNLLRDGRIIGRFYLDLHPRENKYKHAACFGYREGVAGQRLPQAVLVCNFPKGDGTPGSALMEHVQVVTFFHEFGHLLHALLGGQQPWIANSGIRTEWDFVEAPSQMLEEWAISYDALKLFARHCETGQTIPKEMARNLRAAAEFGKGLFWGRQLYYAAMSLDFYNRDPGTLDTTGRMIELRDQYSPFPYVDGVHYQCNIGHLDHYSAIYYTYVWSKGISRDLFSRFSTSGMFDARTARQYRQTILEPGGSRKAADLVQAFLGRPYSFDAFEQWLSES